MYVSINTLPVVGGDRGRKFDFVMPIPIISMLGDE